MKEIPEALFVHIIRDGCDIALSLRKLGDFNPFPWSRRPAALPPVAANGTVHASPVARCLSPPRQRNLVYQGLGKERCCESGLESGAITVCAGADRRPLGVLQMRIVSRRRVQARWVYNGCVFQGQEGNCGSEPWVHASARRVSDQPHRV